MGKTATARHIGQQIRRRRLVLHISQEALGASLGGITQQAVSKMERGGEVSGSQLLELSGLLDVPVSYFFDGLEPDAAVPPRAAGSAAPRHNVA